MFATVHKNLQTVHKTTYGSGPGKVQGRSKRSGWSGNGWTSFDLKVLIMLT